MTAEDKINILLVDDQPAKLVSYEAVLRELGENILKASSAQEAFEHLLRTDIAVVLVDVYMPDLDGFELTRMIREHPRFQKTAVIFISAVLVSDLDFLRGYEVGAVDYVPVPIVPEILRAKVKIFAELYRKSLQLERLNRDLEQRVAERTAALEASTAELRESEERLRLAFDAAPMGWWDYDISRDLVTWSPSLARIMGFPADSAGEPLACFLARVHPEDRSGFGALIRGGAPAARDGGCELRFLGPEGAVRWALAAGQLIHDAEGQPIRFAGLNLDITERKQAEERQMLLVRELDHRAKNLLAVVQSVLHLTKARTTPEFIAAVTGRIKALSRAHTMLSETRWQGVELARIVEEEMAPFATTGQAVRIKASGPAISLLPATAQSLAVALHELATNAAKYGALSVPYGHVTVAWELEPAALALHWIEKGGPPTMAPAQSGFGIKVITGSIEHQLGGRSTFDWGPEGLRCSLTIPGSQLRASRAPANASARVDETGAGETRDAVGPRAGPGARILVVEDEALIAAMVQEVLGEFGLALAGPFGDVGQALSAARDDDLRGAILDINLGGDSIYPVADILAARGIPFVFLTGYARESIDRRYSHIPAIEKPIEPELLRKLLHDGHLAGVAEDADDMTLPKAAIG
jgi:PAS domain S-box-containing protein